MDGKTNRVAWKDVASCIGIFLIQTAHVGEMGGEMNTRVWIALFANPLFFLLSGLFADNADKYSLKQFVIKQFKRLIVPYAAWAAFNILYFAILNNTSSVREILQWVKMYVVGNVANGYKFGGTSWFLIGIFIAKIMYECIRRTLKNKTLTILFCFMLWVILDIIGIYTGADVTKYAYMRGVYFLFFYSLGPIIYEHLNKQYNNIIGKNKQIKYKAYIEFAVLAVISGICWIKSSDIDRICVEYRILYSDLIVKIVLPFIFSMFIVECSFWIKSNVLSEIGRNTIVLCGAESVVKSIVVCCFSFIGLNIKFTDSQIYAYIYVLLCFTFYYKIVIPISKRITT